MRRTFLLVLAAAALTVGWHGSLPVAGQVPDAPPPGVPPFLFQGPDGARRIGGPEQRFPDFNTVTRGAKEYDGLFKLYHLDKEERLYAELNDFNDAPGVQDKFDSIGYLAGHSPPPEELTRFIEKQIALWTDVVAKAGLTHSQ